jgi:response regulator RpfG family c-di-GMP phosphodiesterase
MGPLGGAAALVATHHEAFDGSGYPRALRGEAIPIVGRVFRLVDTYEALTSHRPYRSARSDPFAREEIQGCAGTQLDPAVCAAFARIDRQEWRAIAQATS